MSGTAKILRVDASMRHQGSVSRHLADKLTDRLACDVIRRDLAAETLPFVHEEWISANFTPADQRTDEQKAALAQSDALVAELEAADTLIIATPIYNFSVPAALKAWIDLVARAGLTFRYTENGPEGLLGGRKAYVIVATGGTEVGSDIDYATDYLKHVLGFIGITDINFIAADRLMVDEAAALAGAQAALEAAA